jgi:copper chaperone CopZ
MARLTVRISGMTCVQCVRAVNTALTAVPGITAADVRVGSATIEHDGRATLDEVAAAVAVAGYTVSSAKEERRVLPLLGEP